MNQLRGLLGVGEGEREEHDYYATSPEAAEWLIKIEDLDNNIWECACGAGHLSKVLEEHGFNVKSTDLIDRGYGEGGVDFFEQSELFNGDIVTNPPYKYAQQFVEHALELIPDGHKVCMFLKVQSETLYALPVWKDRSMASTVFGGKQSYDYWMTIFRTAKTPDGRQVLAKPLNTIEMIKRN